MTYGELKTRVLRRVIDLPSAVSTEVPDLVNEAIKDLQDQHNFYIMQALSTATTDSTAGDGGRVLLVKPTDFKAPRGKPWRRGELGAITRMGWAPNRADAEVAFGVASDDTGAPTAVLLAEQDEDGVGNIEVWPLPDALSDWTTAPAGEYRVVMPYWKYLPDLSADGDSNWFTTNAVKYILAQATAEAFALNWDEQRAILYGQTAQVHAAKLIKTDKRRDLAGVDEWPTYTGARGPRSTKSQSFK